VIERGKRRRALFDAQDEIDRRREQLIAEIEGKLQQKQSCNRSKAATEAKPPAAICHPLEPGMRLEERLEKCPLRFLSFMDFIDEVNI